MVGENCAWRVLEGEEEEEGGGGEGEDSERQVVLTPG